MTTITRLSSIGLLAIVLAACGGTAATIAPDGTERPPVATEAPPAATEAPPEGTTPPVDPGALPSFDPADILANLEGIDSYRIQMATDGTVGYQAVVVTKPVLSRDIRLGEGDDAQRIVVIGDEAWMSGPDGFEPLPAELASSMLLAFDPIALAGGFADTGAWTGATEVGSEERNGVDTTHYRIDGSTFGAMMPQLPPGASIDIWIAKDGGYIVAMEVIGEGGKGFQIDVSGINDPENVVERPV